MPGTSARPARPAADAAERRGEQLIRQHAIKAKLGQGVQRNGGALADQDYIWLGGCMLEGQTGLWGRGARRDGYTLTEGANDEEGAAQGYNAVPTPPTWVVVERRVRSVRRG